MRFFRRAGACSDRKNFIVLRFEKSGLDIQFKPLLALFVFFRSVILYIFQVHFSFPVYTGAERRGQLCEFYW